MTSEERRYCISFECDKREWCMHHAVHLRIEDVEGREEIDAGGCMVNGYLYFRPTDEAKRRGVR